jgi:hypothetical protein
MSFISDIGRTASDVGHAVAHAAADPLGTAGDAAKSVGKALGGAPGDVVDGAVDLVGKLPEPVGDALKAAALFTVAAPALGLSALGAGATGAAGNAAAPHLPGMLDKLEGKDLKDARAHRAEQQENLLADKAKAQEQKLKDERRIQEMEKAREADKLPGEQLQDFSMGVEPKP